MASAIYALLEAVLEQVRKDYPTPQIRNGTITRVTRADQYPDPTPRWIVMVSGIASEPIPCGYSSIFTLELSTLDQQLVGMRVEVHLVNQVATIAYSIGGSLV